LVDADGALERVANDRALPDDLRVEALAAAAPRLAKIEPELFQLLLKCAGPETPAIQRLAAAAALGSAHLDDGQLAALTARLAQAGPLEISPLLAPFTRGASADVGQKLVAALSRSPGLGSVTPDTLLRTLAHYPAEVQLSAQALFKRLSVDLEQMQARLADLTPLVQGGDAKRGRELFFSRKANCSVCHSVQSLGGQVGPDLTKIAAIRTGTDLLEAVVFPSASFARGYEPFLVETKSGLTVQGTVRRQTADGLLVMKPDLTEQRIPQAEIESIVPSKVSLMPDGLVNQFSREDLRDLIAFLSTLK
jgi:putative heme-binding domain-containing protein